MNHPYFSVVLPVYNAAPHLAATIRSILNQSDGEFELIIIDDGSTDESLSIMLPFADQDNRIKLISQNNQGVSSARNLGIEMAKGQMVAFIDSDDLWRSEKLAIHRAFHIQNEHLAGSFAKIAFIDNDATDGYQARTYSTVEPGPISVDKVIAENPTCTTSNLVVAKRTIDQIGGFLAGMSYAEDQEWLARIVSNGHVVEGLDHYLVDYRMNPNGLSVDLAEMYAGWRKLADIYQNESSIETAEAIFCRYLSRRALRAGAPAQVAMAYAIQGVRSDPSAFLKDTRRGWPTLMAAFVALLIPRTARIHLFA